MSTTDRETLTDVFEDNHGTDKTMVHDGSIIYPLLASGPASGPRDTADGTRLQKPFFYDPSKGNLLIDRLVFADNISRQANIDRQLTPFARILINDDDPFSATGSLLTSVAVTQFEFAPSVLQAGDADQDWDFDQMDLVQVQVAAKYLTGQPATWGEGDWDGAPGGEPGNPPPGNGLFDQLDVVAALAAGTYLTGPYPTVQPNGQPGDGQTSVVYNAGTGEVSVDAPAGTDLTSINIDSASGIFTGEAATNLGGSFDNDADGNIFKATFGSSFGSLSFGNVARAGLSEEFVLNDLTVIGSLAGGGDLGNVDLVYVPEPASALLLVVGLAMGLLRINNRLKSR